jgi:hypothetical protein
MVVPIDKVVRDACREAGDMDYKNYMPYLQFANDAYRDLSLYVIPTISELTVKTEVLSCGQNQVVNLPSDFVYETKVGICRGGKIVLLTLNEDICQPIPSVDANCDCQVTEQVENALCGSCQGDYYAFNGYNYNGSVGEVYGMSLGFNVTGYYKIDKAGQRLLLQGIPQDADIIIEYKSNGVGAGAELIPTEAENAIREYILFKAFRLRDKGFSDRALREYKIEYNKLKKLYSSYTADDWHRLLLNNTTPTVKN